MDINLLIIDDDNHVKEILFEYFEHNDMKKLIKVKYFRKPEEAESWLIESSESVKLQCCILDLMFPPQKGESISGDIDDLANGLKLFDNYLKGKIKTIVLTGALNRSNDVKTQVKRLIVENESTVIIEKPPDWDAVVDLVKNWILAA